MINHKHVEEAENEGGKREKEGISKKELAISSQFLCDSSLGQSYQE
jgi:hypothetical protein